MVINPEAIGLLILILLTPFVLEALVDIARGIRWVLTTTPQEKADYWARRRR